MRAAFLSFFFTWFANHGVTGHGDVNDNVISVGGPTEVLQLWRADNVTGGDVAGHESLAVVAGVGEFTTRRKAFVVSPCCQFETSTVERNKGHSDLSGSIYTVVSGNVERAFTYGLLTIEVEVTNVEFPTGKGAITVTVNSASALSEAKDSSAN